MSEIKTSEDLSRDITFDGENISEWFKFDRQVLRRAKKLYGKYGDKLWNGTTTPIDDQTVNAIAQDTHLTHGRGAGKLILCKRGT